jgi:hypothetical protein
MLALGMWILTLNWIFENFFVNLHFLLVLSALSMYLGEAAILLLLKRLRIKRLWLITRHIFYRGSAFVRFDDNSVA